MSKALMNTALGGAAVAGAVVVAVLTGLIDLGGTDTPEAVQASATQPDAQPGTTSKAEPLAQTGDTPEAQTANAPEPKTEPSPEPQAEAQAAPEPQADSITKPQADSITEPQADTAAANTQPAPQPSEPAADPEPAPPRFDTVRAEPGGSTLVAGAGEPGAQVEVLVGGEPLGSAEIGADGKFVAFVDLPSQGGASVLTLRVMQRGRPILSEREVIVIPAALPQEMAFAAPDTSEAPALSGSADAAPEGTAPAQAQAPAQDATASAAPRPGAVAAPDAPAAPEAVTEAPAAPGSAPAGAVRAGEPATGTASAADTVPSVEDSAPQAPTVLMAGPDGVEAVPSAPLAPGNVALDSIRYDQDGEVHISGRGTDTAFVRVYLDNSPVTTSRIQDDGVWRVQLPAVDTGTYTLRVDQVNDQGQVLARVESPFLREDPEVLAALAAGAGPVAEITVQPGHTLWAISKTRYGDGVQYVKIFNANKDRIRNPDLIYPGQIFALPDAAQPEAAGAGSE